MKPFLLVSIFDSIFIVLCLVALANLALAFLVMRSTLQREEKRVFAVTATSVAFWTLTNALFRIAGTVDAATLWAQFSYLAALATAASFLHFAWVFLKRSHIRFNLKLLLWLLAGMVSLLAFLPGFVIQGINLQQRQIVTAPGIYIIAAFLLGTSTLTFVTFWKSQSRLHRQKRDQVRYVLLGASLTAVFGLTFNLLLPLEGNYHLVWMGPSLLL